MLNVTLKLKSDEYLFDPSDHPMTFSGFKEIISYANTNGYTYVIYNGELYMKYYTTGSPLWIRTRLEVAR